jgi:phosphohistidine phosphatase
MSMNLYLVQHGKPESEEEDPGRPLSDGGRSDVNKIGAFIARQDSIQVKKVFHSGKLRARQTAELLSKFLNPSEGVSAASGLNPLDDPQEWVERLSEVKRTFCLLDIFLISINPHPNYYAMTRIKNL